MVLSTLTMRIIFLFLKKKKKKKKKWHTEKYQYWLISLLWDPSIPS